MHASKYPWLKREATTVPATTSHYLSRHSPATLSSRPAGRLSILKYIGVARKESVRNASQGGVT